MVVLPSPFLGATTDGTTTTATSVRFACCAFTAAAVALSGCYVGAGAGAAKGSDGSSGDADAATVVETGESESESGSDADGGDTGAAGCSLDQVLEPTAYGTKVKTLLTGLALTNEESQTLSSDPGVLPALVDAWQVTAEADIVLERFFRTAFQQTSPTGESLRTLFGVSGMSAARFEDDGPRTDDLLNKNFADSFAKTALRLVREQRPFTEVLTTDTYMMTTALKMFLVFNDDFVVGDNPGIFTQTLRTTDGHFPTIRLLRDPPQPPLEEVLDPGHPNYMTFYSYRIGSMIPDGCDVTPVLTVDTTQEVPGEWSIGTGGHIPFYVFSAIMFGVVARVHRPGMNCGSGGAGSVNRPLLAPGDFEDWMPVKIVRPPQGQDADYFYDVPALRAADEIHVLGERVGFLMHPGFLSTWLTNEDNSMRVALNQALIVALGASFEGATVTDFDSEAIDLDHADSEACLNCHRQLDPMRNFYRASFSNNYGVQLDPERASLKGEFEFSGVQAQGDGVGELATILSEHPAFAPAWAQKLCWYANGAACPKGEELDRVVAAFEDSGHDFGVLVRTLMSSPLVTAAECIQDAAAPGPMISRRSSFCQQLDARLGTQDVCALALHDEYRSPLQHAVARAAGSIPDDGFSRSVVAPTIISDTGMFTRANREAVCTIVAQDAFDAVYGSMARDEVLESLVGNLMGLASPDPRRERALEILRSHVDDAVATGETESAALKSAMALACLSPSNSGVGF